MGIVEGARAQPGVQCGSFRLVGVADRLKTGQQLCHRRAARGLRTPPCALPRPRVASVRVETPPRPEPANDAAPVRLFQLVRAGFGQRRKMLRRSLADLVEPAAFEAAAVRPEARAEELSVLDWGRLATASPS